MSDNCYLYSITNKVNGKLYVGITSQPRKRFDFHCRKDLNDNMAIRRSIKKYGRENFEFKVMMNGSRSYCAEMEKKAIISFGSKVPTGYNISNGGEGKSTPCSEEHKERLRKLFTGRPISAEQKAKISATLKGRPLSEETKAKLCISLKGRVISEKHKEINRKALTGLKRSDETRAKLSKANTGKKKSAEENAKHSQTLKQRWADPEFRTMMMNARKKNRGVS